VLINVENFASTQHNCLGGDLQLPLRLCHEKKRTSAVCDSYFSFSKIGDRAETLSEKESRKILPDERKAACFLHGRCREPQAPFCQYGALTEPF